MGVDIVVVVVFATARIKWLLAKAGTMEAGGGRGGEIGEGQVRGKISESLLYL